MNTTTNNNTDHINIDDRFFIDTFEMTELPKDFILI